MQFTSQSINYNLLIKTRLSAICFCGLIIAGCTSSDDPVEQVNVAPVAVVDDVAVIKGSTTPLNLAANDSDADDGLDLASIVIVADSANGTVVVNADGSVTYSHDGSATVTDQFTYNIKDNSGAVSNTASVAITITTPAPNVAPVAVVDAFTVIKSSTMPFNLAANDSDADDGLDLESIVIDSDPANGTVVVNTGGIVTYTHDGSDTASDSFSYTIKDNSGAVSNIAKVEITVSPPAVQVGIYDSTVVEGADDLEFVISLSAASAETIIVDYATSNGTALAGTDYSAASGTVQFAPGEVRKFVTVSVLSNTVAQTDTSKNLQFVLSDPRNAQLSIDTGTGTIIDREKMSTDSIFDHNWSPVGVFSGAVICADCHTSNGTIMQFDNTDVSLSTNDISPSTQWKHSVMANAFNDPYWQAAVEDEVDSFPRLSGLIEDTCTKCHAPMGRTHAYHTNTNLDAEGYYRFDTAKGEDISREGVSCTACHQMLADGTDSGGYIISGETTNKVIYGPYANPRTNPMLSNTTYTPVESNHVESSELCASCHTLYTPSLDPDTGAPTGINFLEQGPYLEWQNSVYATGQAQEAQCQDCHMSVPSDTYETVISTRPPGNQLSPRQPFGQHTLVGGNAHLLEILRDYRSDLGIASSTTVTGFDDQIALTRNFLGSAAEVTVSTLATVGNNLEFNVEVSNNAGHKLPSAYPSRRVWLHVVVKSAGQTVFESGKPDSRGYISTDIVRLKADCMSAHKLEGFDTSICYEPHRDVINNQSQVAIYETVLGDINNNITHTLLQGAKYLKDNRIPPAGFTNSKATTIEPQTVPSGVSGDNNFNCVSVGEGCGKDSVHYQVNTEGQSGPYFVEVRLLYQATQPGFVDGMHNVGDRVNRFKVMYDAVPPSVEVLATASKQE